MNDLSHLGGWNPNPAGVERWLKHHSNKTPLFADHGPKIVASEIKDTFLYEYLLRLHPTWKRGAQGIGDCTSWGWEIACTILMATQIAKMGRLEGFLGEAATEAIYGGARVEAEGRKTGGWTDGWYGAGCAKWVKNWGVVLRKDHSIQTGNKEHDLTRYSSDKAKNWGNYGCGGQNDKSLLDAVAKLHPVQSTALVTTFEQAAAAIMNGYPVPVCSGQGFASTRDKDGFARGQGSWSHCMCFVGCRGGSRPGLLCMNSWGASCSGPVWPETMPEAVRVCTWWVEPSTANSMLRGEDSFAVSELNGFPPAKLPDWGLDAWKKLFG